MAECPKCGSKKVGNKNTRQVIVLGGTSHHVCQSCGCRWIHCCATGQTVAVHGNVFKAESIKNPTNLSILSKKFV